MQTMDNIAGLVATAISSPDPATIAEVKIVLSGLANGHVKAGMAAYAALKQLDPLVAKPVLEEMRRRIDELENIEMEIHVSRGKCTCGKCGQPKTHRN